MALDTKIIWNGQGPIDFGVYDPKNGSADSAYVTGLYQVGCGSRTLTTNLSTEQNALTESCTGQALTLAELPGAKSMSVSLTLVQFDARTLARALLGEAVVVQGSTVTNETLGPVKDGDIFYTKYPRISSLVIEDSTASPVSYTENTHYKILDKDQGRCQLIKHPVAHEEPLLADYTYGDSINIAMFSKTSVETAIVFSGMNSFGQKGRLIIPKTNLKLEGDFGWLTEPGSATELTLSGQALFAPELQGDSLYGGFARLDLMTELA